MHRGWFLDPVGLWSGATAERAADRGAAVADAGSQPWYFDDTCQMCEVRGFHMELRRREPPALPSVFVLAELAGVRDLLRFVDGLLRGKTYHTPDMAGCGPAVSRKTLTQSGLGCPPPPTSDAPG